MDPTHVDLCHTYIHLAFTILHLRKVTLEIFNLPVTGHVSTINEYTRAVIAF